MMKRKDRHSKDKDYIIEFEYEELNRDLKYTDFEDAYNDQDDYDDPDYGHD